jgi:hypothetical protein
VEGCEDSYLLLWEQSFSFDKGETWDKNWIMESTRVVD